MYDAEIAAVFLGSYDDDDDGDNNNINTPQLVVASGFYNEPPTIYLFRSKTVSNALQQRQRYMSINIEHFNSYCWYDK